MRSTRRALIAAIGVGFFIASSAIATTAYAAAPGGGNATDPYEPSFGEPSEVIYIDAPAPRVEESSVLSRSSTSAGNVVISRSDDLPASPAPGETIRIVYTDSVTEVSAAAAGSCTKTISADTPTKTNNRPMAYGRGSISSGCSSSSNITLAIYNGWDMYATKTWTVYTGGLNWGSQAQGDICATGFNTDFYAIAAWSSGGSVNSPHVTLPCRKS